jgi:hypothetical protein
MKHYNKIIDVINNALQAALYIPDKSDDPDLVEYFKVLREHLLECLTCTIHCLKDINQIGLIENYLVTIIDFSNKVCNDVYEPSLVRFFLFILILNFFILFLFLFFYFLF